MHLGEPESGSKWMDMKLNVLFAQHPERFGSVEETSTNKRLLKKNIAFFADRLSRRGFEGFEALCGPGLPAKQTAHWIREQQKKVQTIHALSSQDSGRNICGEWGLVPTAADGERGFGVGEREGYSL